ncbi:hypothetical protein AAFF_G00045980 [Aldrovandia affinis]|uniref:Uncharacterized protein n=1 Tax=Aldrovandia affinis TaxID=143900 RepID=A0AAD7S273_9TELE|nr:hypothetical protein AAFF_G00045980 [Aldrovandia affinis]
MLRPCREAQNKRRLDLGCAAAWPSPPPTPVLVIDFRESPALPGTLTPHPQGRCGSPTLPTVRCQRFPHWLPAARPRSKPIQAAGLPPANSRAGCLLIRRSTTCHPVTN